MQEGDYVDTKPEQVANHTTLVHNNQEKLNIGPSKFKCSSSHVARDDLQQLLIESSKISMDNLQLEGDFSKKAESLFTGEAGEVVEQAQRNVSIARLDIDSDKKEAKRRHTVHTAKKKNGYLTSKDIDMYSSRKSQYSQHQDMGEIVKIQLDFERLEQVLKTL